MKNAFTENYIKTVINDDHDVGTVQDARIAPKYLRKNCIYGMFLCKQKHLSLHEI